MSDWKPWEHYPHIWKTEAAFWSHLRGCLRKAVWERSPIKLDFKNKNTHPPPKGYTGRAKSGAECALTGVWIGKSKMEVDHIKGNKPLKCEEDILDFIKHLIPPPGTMQLVDKKAHEIKSYAERKGITFEAAIIEKEAIAIMKENSGRDWLRKNDITPESNENKRRQQVKQRLENDNNSL